MKKAILILISVLLFALPVFGYSKIQLSDCPKLDTGEPMRNYIKILPDSSVPRGSVITLEYENAYVYAQEVIDGNGDPSDKGFKGKNSTYQYNGLKGEYKWNQRDDFEEAMQKTKTSQVPYHIKRLDGKKVEILLCDIPKTNVERTLKHDGQEYGEPYYYIPLTAYVADGDKEVKVKITGPANGFIRDTVIVAANEKKPVVSSESTTDIIETTTESTTADYKATVKIGSDILNVSGHEFTLDAVPYIQQISGAAMVPLRAVSLALADGYNGAGSINVVAWDDNTKTAIITYKGRKLEFTANADHIIVNGKRIKMDNGVYPEIKDGRMFVPFRALGEAFGIEVNWDSNTWTASFN